MFDRIHQWSHMVLDFCVGGAFFSYHSFILLFMIGLFVGFISSWFILGGFCLSMNLSISSRLFILLANNWQTIHYDPLYFCGVHCNFFFIYNFIDLSPLLFFSWRVRLKAYQFWLSFFFCSGFCHTLKFWLSFKRTSF